MLRKSTGARVGLALAYNPSMAFRILVVEDDAATRRGLTQLLTGAGYEVAETASMTEALNLLHPNSRIWSSPTFGWLSSTVSIAAVNPQRIPVIIVTGYADRGLEAEARTRCRLPAQPVKPSQLLAVVERRLRLRRTAIVSSSRGDHSAPSAKRRVERPRRRYVRTSWT